MAMAFSKGYLPCEIDETTGQMKPKYTYETLLPKIEEYFEEEPWKKRPTRSGLAIYLGVTTETIRNYENSKAPRVSDAIKWAITRMEQPLEEMLPDQRNPAGTMFALKNIAGWKENNEVEVKGSGSFNIVTNIPRPKED